MKTYRLLYNIFLLVPIIYCIQIPLPQSQFRCMLVYSYRNDDTVKIDINFPYIQNWNNSDRYLITLRNTRTGTIKSQEHSYGHYRRQIHIYEKVIYQLCFQFLSPRRITQQILVDYDADTHYMLNKQTIKFPQNLLKVQNMKQAYQNVMALKNLTQNYKKLQQERQRIQQQQFIQTSKIQNKMMGLFIVEIGVILGIGIYQFWQIKKGIKEVQYM